MQAITRNDETYMSFFKQHKMFSYWLGGCVSYIDILEAGIKVMKKFEIDRNSAEALQGTLVVQTEQRFFTTDFELSLLEQNITILDEPKENRDMNSDEEL